MYWTPPRCVGIATLLFTQETPDQMNRNNDLWVFTVMVPLVVADMVRLQLLCAVRPGEICAMRPCDVTRSVKGDWTYRPAFHKTEHLDRERRISIGLRGQANRPRDRRCCW